MQINVERTRQYLKQFNFQPLFIDELGWDRHRQTLNIEVGENGYTLTAIAEKRGMVVFECQANTAGGGIPKYATRRKIQQEVAKSVHENFIIYTDTEKVTQIWQWARREHGKPTACREHPYHITQHGDSLIQKLDAIAFSFEEEGQITLFGVTSRVQASFYIERVTKRFYEDFKREHTAFLRFLNGIPDQELQRWYASIMLNRLMFIYFIQKKGFLNADANYLRTKLKQIQEQGSDQYYKEFLCPLFFEGVAKQESDRSRSVKRLLGTVPYLNGGIFQKHQVETHHGEGIEIPDAAFEKLFRFFEKYQWHLDDRPLRNDNEINPEVLGYIFEKYINQKDLGAYYTKEDITDYISKNTIIPSLFETARKACKTAFEGDKAVWKLLQDDPDRYIYEAVKKGVELGLPQNIADGIVDVSKRTDWNTLAPSGDDGYALPTETWREFVARKQHYKIVRSKLANGEITDINALITYNLDIRQFAQSVIENCETPELLCAFWKSVTKMTILDPTCGSGAFLFAGLNILEPLYEACLDRMQAFVDELLHSPQKTMPEQINSFREILEDVDKHPNRKYFILKSIIIKNLYGVDFMEEAIEICKLRLFLKLVAQIEDVRQIEPLPDIDFNVRTGNTLVGYTTFDELERDVPQLFDNRLTSLKEEAENVKHLFSQFQKQQTSSSSAADPTNKQRLQRRFKDLEDELNLYLAEKCNIDVNNRFDYSNWSNSHKPFHWFIAFYGILQEGGFDIIIGNPPYLELRQVDYIPLTELVSYETQAIHAMCIDRSLQLLNQQGGMSMIVPLSLVCTRRMGIIQNLLEKERSVWYANYSWRPGKLFDAVNNALTIFIANPSSQQETFSTNYQKWSSKHRDLLMNSVNYVEIPRHRPAFWAPKLGNGCEAGVLEKFIRINTVLQLFTSRSQHRVYYRVAGGLYWKVFTDFPPPFMVDGEARNSTAKRSFSVETSEILKPVIALLSSDLFWWWYTITSDCRNLSTSDINNFPTPKSALYDPQLVELGRMYLEDLIHNSTMHVRVQQRTGRIETQMFKIQKSKHIIDKIDRVLAKHYGFTDEELDFIINYDIKYRMGLGN